MTVLNRIKNFVAAFVQPVEAGGAPDSIAYHSQPDERELRFSRSNVFAATIEGVHGRLHA